MSVSCNWNALTRTTGLPSSITQWSFSGWFYFPTAVTSYPDFCYINNSGESQWLSCYRPNGDGLFVYNETYGGVSLSTYVWQADSWIWIAGSWRDTPGNPGTVGAVWEDGGTLDSGDSGTSENANDLSTPTSIRVLGNTSTALCSAIKMWDSFLDLDQLLNERRTIIPKHTDNLYVWLPIVGSTIAECRQDYSGNGRDFSGGSAYDSRTPPIPWGGYPIIIGEVGDTGISGTADITLGSLTASSAGEVDVDGTAAITLGSLTSTAAGEVDIDGDADITLGSLTSTSAGEVDIDGALAVTLGTLTLSSTGVVGSSPITGDADITLGTLTVSSAGDVVVDGTLSVTLGTLTGASVGEVDVGGTLNVTLGALTAASAGEIDLEGSANITLGALTPSAAGEVDIDGSLAVTLGILVAAGVGTVSGKFNGGIDEAYYGNRALSPFEIDALANNYYYDFRS